jgi:hypothetical protein
MNYTQKKYYKPIHATTDTITYIYKMKMDNLKKKLGFGRLAFGLRMRQVAAGGAVRASIAAKTTAHDTTQSKHVRFKCATRRHTLGRILVDFRWE